MSKQGNLEKGFAAIGEAGVVPLNGANLLDYD